jgi:outer membrane protein
MKRTLAIIAMLASGFVLSASAQTPAAAGSTKVAVIAFRDAVFRTNEGQRDLADLEKKFQPRMQALQKLSDEIDGMSKQLEAQGDKLAPAEQQSRAAAIEAKKKTAQRDYEDYQNDSQQALQQLYSDLSPKVYDVLRAYVEQQGITVVIDSSTLLYAAPNTDITKAIMDAYNVKSGVPAPPAAPAAPAAAPKGPAAH